MTAFHRKVADQLKEIRNESGVMLGATGVSNAFKPMKMGLRISNLHEPWSDFVETYDNVHTTCAKLFRISLSKEEREIDLEAFKKIRDIMKQN